MANFDFYEGEGMCKKKGLMAVTVLLIALTVLGSFLDYQTAQAVYIGQMPNENFFGVLFAFIGIIPTFVGWSFLGASILCLARKQDLGKKKRGFLTALSVLLFVLSFFYFCNTLFLVNETAFSVHWAIAYSVGVATISLAAYLGYKLAKNSKNPNLLKKILFLTAVSLLTMVVVMLTKELMDRPRYRLVIETGRADFFRNWWQSGSAVKESLGANAVSDEFASFPSGHSAYAMFAIFIFPLLADYTARLEKYRGVLFIGGVLWWGLTAFSRMTVGAHYLTDVCIAGLVTVFAYVFVLWVKVLVARGKKAKELND